MSRAFDILEFGSPDTPIRPFWVDVSPDHLGWLFFGLLCLVASLGTGLLPAWHLSRSDANDILKDGGRLGGALRARRWNTGLLIAEIALTMMLLAGNILIAVHVESREQRNQVEDLLKRGGARDVTTSSEKSVPRSLQDTMSSK